MFVKGSLKNRNGANNVRWGMNFGRFLWAGRHLELRCPAVSSVTHLITLQNLLSRNLCAKKSVLVLVWLLSHLKVSDGNYSGVLQQGVGAAESL